MRHTAKKQGGLSTDYVRVAGQSLARVKSTGGITYVHTDHLGSMTTATTQSNTVEFRESYTPFGETLINSAANDNQSGFTNHIKDKATGLNYMQARYYDPNIGRFLSIDPVTFMETNDPTYFNRYAYCGSDPVNCFDPTSMAGFKVDVEVSVPTPIPGVLVEGGFSAMVDTETGEFGVMASGGPGVGVAAGAEVTGGYFDNSIQSTTAPAGELNVNVPLTPAGVGVAADVAVGGKPIGTPPQGPIDNTLNSVMQMEGLPVDFQSVDVGASVGVGGYVAATAGVALTNKGVYAGGKDVTSQAKALHEKTPTPFIKN